MTLITHRRFGRSEAFSDEGVTLNSWLRPRFFTLPWTEVDFVSPIPSVELEGGAWRFKRFALLKMPSLLDTGHLVLDIVVADWRRVRPQGTGVRFVPLAPPEDRKGTLSLDLRVGSLSASPEDLLALLAQHVRFDLLCHLDE